MSLAWLFYSVVLALWLGAAALLLERPVAHLRWPTRWIWIAALTIAVAWPHGPALAHLASRLQATPPATDSRPNFSSTGQGSAAGRARFRYVVPLEATPTLTRAYPLLAGMAYAASGIAALTFGACWLLLTRRRGQWRRTQVAGRDVWVASALGPAVVGFARPEIVVPEWLCASEPALQEVVLRHEASHIAARDPLLVLYAGVALVLMPWNLALWWLVHRLRLAIEIDCDQRVLRAGTEVGVYGRLLLDAAERATASRFAVLGALSPLPTTLERRLSRMIASAPRFLRLRLALATAIAGTVLASACATEAPEGAPAMDATISPDAAAARAPADANAGPTTEDIKAAVRRFYGDRPPVTAGTPPHYWFVATRGGDIVRHAVGTEDVVWDHSMPRLPGHTRPGYDLDGSVHRKYPDLTLRDTSRVRSETLAGLVLGTDSIRVIWVQLAH